MLGVAQTAWKSRAWAQEAPSGDPYWSDVVMLVNALDGTVADRSSIGATISVVQSPGGVASTTQTKFNGYSIYNQANSRFKVAANAARQCSGQFTYEYWAWSSSSTSTYNCPWCPINTTSNAGWMNGSCGTSKSGRMSVEFTQSYTNYYVSGSTMHNSTWHHIAIVRGADNVIRFYYDGVAAAATRSSTATIDFGTYDWLLGGYMNNAGDNTWAGYMDDIRLTKGVARYTANFTPPTEAFPIG